jgi:large subunit ribosomal protein L23
MPSRSIVEELFEVKVLRVHTQNRKGKPRRTKMRLGYTQDWKKAIVTLDAEHRIELF